MFAIPKIFLAPTQYVLLISIKIHFAYGQADLVFTRKSSCCCSFWEHFVINQSIYLLLYHHIYGSFCLSAADLRSFLNIVRESLPLLQSKTFWSLGPRWHDQTCPTVDVTRKANLLKQGSSLTAMNISRKRDLLVGGFGRGSLKLIEFSTSKMFESNFFRTPISRVRFLFEDSVIVVVPVGNGNIFRFRIG